MENFCSIVGGITIVFLCASVFSIMFLIVIYNWKHRHESKVREDILSTLHIIDRCCAEYPEIVFICQKLKNDINDGDKIDFSRLRIDLKTISTQP